MRKEPIVLAAVLLTFAVVAFVMAWVTHDELMNGEVVVAIPILPAAAAADAGTD